MQKFGWKRKRSALSKLDSTVFTGNTSDDEDLESDEIDWLTSTKRSKVFVLEDATIKGARLKKEGIVFANEDRWWAAIKQWGAACALLPADHTLPEMMAQAYMQVEEYVLSVQHAQTAVSLSPLWWCGHQTLGRALMSMGELHSAVLCFSRCLRLHPANDELREHDLKWASELLATYRHLQSKKETAPPVHKLDQEEKSIEIIDLKDNPGGFESFEASFTPKDNNVDASSESMSSSSSKLKVNIDNRISVSKSAKFVSCCSSNKSDRAPQDDQQDGAVSISNMVCMRPKLPK